MKQRGNDAVKDITLGEERPLSSLLRAKTALAMGLFVFVTTALLFVAENLQVYRWEADKLSDGLEEAYDASLGNISNLLFEVCQSTLMEYEHSGISDINEYLSHVQDVSQVAGFIIVDPDGRSVNSSLDTDLGYGIGRDISGAGCVEDIFQRTTQEKFFNFMQYIDENPEYLSDGEKNYYGYYVRLDHRIAEAGSVLLTGLTESDFNLILGSRLCIFARNAILGENGGFMVLKEIEDSPDEYYVFGKKNMIPYMYRDSLEDLDTIVFHANDHEEGKAFYYTFPSGRYLCMYRRMGGVLCVAAIPKPEMDQIIIKNIIFVAALLLLLVGVMNIGLQRMLDNSVVEPIHNMTKTLDVISTGSLDTQMDVRDNLEFSALSDDINKMVQTLKQYIREAATKIDRELAIARGIQLSSVPNTFPAFSNRSDFDVFPSMETAREVGGDFYDYFLVDDDHLALVMADVSDKGIPAAMFMMRAKAKIHDRAKRGGTPAQILYDSNNSLCKMNKEKLFVTVWLAIIELSTGRGLEANAGHEHPAFYKNDSYRLVKYPHSPPVASFPNLPYTDREFTLHPGDKIFVYTDGITDATNKEKKRFGEDALVMALNELKDKGPQETISGIRERVNNFVQDATQFDDMTMCAFIYYGNQENQDKERADDSK